MIEFLLVFSIMLDLKNQARSLVKEFFMETSVVSTGPAREGQHGRNTTARFCRGEG